MVYRYVSVLGPGSLAHTPTFSIGSIEARPTTESTAEIVSNVGP